MTMFYIMLAQKIKCPRNRSGVTTIFRYVKLTAPTNPQARQQAVSKFRNWQVRNVSKYAEPGLHYVTRLSGPTKIRKSQ